MRRVHLQRITEYEVESKANNDDPSNPVFREFISDQRRVLERLTPGHHAELPKKYVDYCHSYNDGVNNVQVLLRVLRNVLHRHDYSDTFKAID